jgi:predicted nuclease of predicted toxin-antitoxin system
MMTPFRLLLDEMISPAIVAPLWERGIDAVALRDRSLLEVSDREVWRIAQDETRTVVTVNGKDFIRLAEREAVHSGVVIIPSGGTRPQQLSYITAATTNATGRNVFAPSFDSRIVTLDEDFSIYWDDLEQANQTGSTQAPRRFRYRSGSS